MMKKELRFAAAEWADAQAVAEDLGRSLIQLSSTIICTSLRAIRP